MRRRRGGQCCGVSIFRAQLYAICGADRSRRPARRVRPQQEAEAPAARLSKGLDARLGLSKRFGLRSTTGAGSGDFDMRQRAVSKVHFFGHGGGGGASLAAHGRYIAREAARGDLEQAHKSQTREAPEPAARAHADYLSGERAVFYDGLRDTVDGRARMAVWAREDRRHFRIILSPENGGRLGDLKSYVRTVMERAESELGSRLEWVAVNHYDTDNPHSHIVLRGRHANGRPLMLPREFVKHGLREIARNAATERLGPRTRGDENAALLREARAHRPTRLDALLARHVKEGKLAIAAIEAPNRDPAVTQALKLRARELQRLGLASEPRRNVLQMNSDWRERLKAMELHLDIRKGLMRERTLTPPYRSTPTPEVKRGVHRGPER